MLTKDVETMAGAAQGKADICEHYPVKFFIRAIMVRLFYCRCNDFIQRIRCGAVFNLSAVWQAFRSIFVLNCDCADCFYRW